MAAKRDKLIGYLGGIRNMGGRPDFIICARHKQGAYRN